MSFASDFGHDIPPDDWDGGYSRRGSKKNYTTYANPLYTKHEKKFMYVHAETDKAYLIEFYEGKAWVPKSHVDLDLMNLKVTMPFWLFCKLKYNKEE